MQLSSRSFSLLVNPGVLHGVTSMAIYETVLCLERKAIAWEWPSLSVNPEAQLQNYDIRCRTRGHSLFSLQPVVCISKHS